MAHTFKPSPGEGYVNGGDTAEKKRAEEVPARAKEQSELGRKYLERILEAIPSAD